MFAVLKKVDGFWTIILKRTDGKFDDFRFVSEEVAKHWANLVGITWLDVVRDETD